MRTIIGLLTAIGAICWMAQPGQARQAAPVKREGIHLPVREVTVFKDGHAFVLHSGQAVTDASGDVQLDHLPVPVLGTFWPYSADKNATLTAVTASASKTRIERPALSVNELLEANPGAQITVTQTDGHKYDAQIIATPRWTPDPRDATSSPEGHAVVSLQATLLNEMLDLNDVTCHLVVGVPTFWFKDTPDPISLQQTFPQLSRFFQSDSQTGYAFSNAIAGQSPGGGLGGGRMSENIGARGGGGAGAAVEGMGADRNEDLFLFTTRHVTLKKGQNMTLPVAEFTLDYKDVYRLDVPITLPYGVQPNGSQAQNELARLNNTPRAQHRIRLINNSKYPITTAPALITNGDRVVAQTLTSYTSVGATLDLALTTAGSVGVKRTEKETKRTPDVEVWQGVHLTRFDLNGTVDITNYDDKPIDLEIARYVPGRIDTVNKGGVFSIMNPLEEDGGEAINGEARPVWWGWYNWPGYWEQFNGLNRVTWNAHLAPKASADFTYAWHYFSSP